jgi:DNA-binding transcriptional LysR family regulator
MDRIEAMRVFARVVERGSFIRAAEDLTLPASTATDAVKQLESRLGVQLLQRTTRHVRVTLDGEAYYRRCLSILDDLEEAETAFRGGRVRGLLRVDVQGTQARRFIVPALPKFFADYPNVQLFLSEGDRFVDLIREGFDCVLRAGEPKDSDLIARRVAVLPEVTVASAEYVARFGAPGRWDAALEGLGVIQVPRYSAEQDLIDGVLVECLPDTPPSSTSPLSAKSPAEPARAGLHRLDRQAVRQSWSRPERKSRLGGRLNDRFGP